MCSRPSRNCDLVARRLLSPSCSLPRAVARSHPSKKWFKSTGPSRLRLSGNSSASQHPRRQVATPIWSLALRIPMQICSSLIRLLYPAPPPDPLPHDHPLGRALPPLQLRTRVETAMSARRHYRRRAAPPLHRSSPTSVSCPIRIRTGMRKIQKETICTATRMMTATTLACQACLI